MSDAYVWSMRAPALRPGDVVIMDNLSVHKSQAACDAIKAGNGESPGPRCCKRCPGLVQILRLYTIVKVQCSKWWRRRELNPRPEILPFCLYMRSSGS